MAVNRQPAGLISLLLDKTAEFGDRDDAAMDLGSFDQPAVVSVLATVASDPSEDDDIVARSGESLAKLWAERGSVDEGLFDRLRPAAKTEVRAYLRARAPELAQAVDR